MSYFTCLGLSFLTCKVGIVSVPFSEVVLIVKRNHFVRIYTLPQTCYRRLCYYYLSPTLAWEQLEGGLGLTAQYAHSSQHGAGSLAGMEDTVAGFN